MTKKRNIWLMVTGVLALGVLIGTFITGPVGAFGPGGMHGFQEGNFSEEERAAFQEHHRGGMGQGMMGLSEEELESFYEERGFEGTQFHRRGMGMGGFSKERHEEMIEWMEENEGNVPCHQWTDNESTPFEDDTDENDDAL